MKRLLFALTLSAAVALPALAQPTDSTAPASTNAPADNPPPPGGGGPGGPGGHHDHMRFLTDAEKAELKKAHDAAIAADPSLATEEEALKAAHEAGTPPTEDQKAQFKAFHDKLDAAMIKADPAVEPIIAKIKAHHPHGPGGDKDGPPPAPPAQ